MKRFIIISLFAVVAAPVFACLGIETYNHYLFHMYDGTEFRDRMDRITMDNWRSYLGLTNDDFYYFDSEKVIEVAQAKGDDLMVSYVKNLKQYLDCAYDVRCESWDYPTKDNLQERERKVALIRQYALGQAKSRLRSQHALLYMRCNMLMGHHAENVQFWEQTASKFIDTVYRNMMENIYAGALAKTGRTEEACTIFANQGDYESLMTLYYKRRSFQAIRQVYEQNPNHPALPFLLQDFVNNAQEALDAANNEGFPGKLFIRDISKEEALKMADFAYQVVCDSKSRESVMWCTAAAWLRYMFGDKKEALRHAETAMTGPGSELSRASARVIRLYILGAVGEPTKSVDNKVAEELTWLYQEREGERDYFTNAYNRIIHQVLANRYKAIGRKSTALALYNSAEDHMYEYALDSMSVSDLLEFYAYVKSSSTNNPLDDFLKRHLENDDNEMRDFIGTKYLRLGEWEKGIQWLDKVPLSYYNEQGYAVYAYYRKPDIEPWIKRQWLDSDAYENESNIRLSKNPKKAVAEEILELENGLKLLKGKARLQRCYDLAVRYAQIHHTGDYWFVLRSTKSEYDEVPPNSVDFAAKAVTMLREASKSDDFKLKERALFGLSYVYLNPDCWHNAHWDRDADDYIWDPLPATQQYKAFAALAEHEKTNPSQTSAYVSRCDEYRQFIKHYQ